MGQEENKQMKTSTKMEGTKIAKTLHSVSENTLDSNGEGMLRSKNGTITSKKSAFVLYKLQDNKRLEVFCEENLEPNPSCRERLAEIYDRYVSFAGEENSLRKRNFRSTFMTLFA